MSKGRFSEVIKEAKQSLSPVSTEITDLTAGNNLTSQSVPVLSISISPNQPRKYFAPEKMQELIQSIKSNGILEPLIVRPLADNKFELVAGERRLRAAKEANLPKVPAIVREMDDCQAFQIALVENLQREELNPVEQAQGIVTLLALNLNKESGEIAPLLYKMQNEAKGKITPNVWGKTEGQRILEIFANLGVNWQTFVKTKLPLLKLPTEILEALRQGSIEYTKAKEIGRVKDPDLREKILTEAIEQNLSLVQIKEKIRQLNFQEVHKDSSLKDRFSNIYIRARKSKVWDDPKKRKQLEKLVAFLETNLAKILEEK